MTELQYNITRDSISIEHQMGFPAFTYNSNTYYFIPSVTEFKRELDTGGFQTIRLLRGQCRLMNRDGTAYIATIPTPQQKITYSVDGAQYRIESIKRDPTQSYFTFIAENTTKGI